MKNIKFSLFLYLKIECESKNPKAIINYCHSKNIPIYKIKISETKSEFYIRSFNFRIIKTYIKNHPEDKVLCIKYGFFKLLDKYGKRWGLFAGGLFFFVSLIVSSKFVWALDIKGNEFTTEADVRNALAKIGLTEGVIKSRIDTSSAGLEFQVKNPEYSFISINFIGTRAMINIRERQSEEKPAEGEFTYSNLVAKESGRIIRFEVYDGNVICKRGNYAEKGTLLVSGIVERKNGSYKLTKSKGAVFAETERVFETIVPYESTSKVYTGREKEVKEYSFLGKKIFVSGKDEPGMDMFDCEKYCDDLTLFGRKLPIRVCHKVYLEYAEKTAIINVDTARDLAYDRYEEFKRDSMNPGYEITKENITFEETENGFEFKCVFSAIENIAEEKALYYNPNVNERENDG